MKDVTVLRHTTGSKLVTLNLLFSANDLTREELPVAGLMATMLGKLPTAKHDSATLQTVVKQKIGKISFGTETYPVMDSLDKCIVNMGTNAVCLENYKDEAADLIIVLDEGVAVGMGTHDELLASCEVYREIHESQFKGGEA